jgi:putative proteasome-type protease
MTYCLGIKTQQGLVMASDSRSNAGTDLVNVCRKMHHFVHPGERVFTLMTSGNLSISQSIVTLLRKQWEENEGLAQAESLYHAARICGQMVRHVAELDRAALERDEFRFNVHLILGGQIKGQEHELYLVYPQGNPITATEESPFLQIGEVKYGRPILDRGIRYEQTSLGDAAKYAIISFDSTMRSNVTVGPPIDLMIYEKDNLEITRHRRFAEEDPALVGIRAQWEQTLRRAIQELPPLYTDSLDRQF